MPSTTSNWVSIVLASSTVMTPSLPTFFMASAMMRPMVSSLFAEMVPTCAIISPDTFCENLSSAPGMRLPSWSREPHTAVTALSMPRFRAIGFAPAATVFTPSRKMVCARTVAVVVPSPATSDVLEATSRTICAPMFSSGSFSSISLATVTPSLVMSGEPNFFSITTLRPLGPRVTFTASARTFTPLRIDCRDSSPCRICFAIADFSSEANAPKLWLLLFGTAKPCPFKTLWSCHPTLSFGKGWGTHCLLGSECRLGSAFQDAEDFFLAHDEEVVAIDLDFRPGVLAEQNAVARLHVERKGFALVVRLTSADGNDFTFLRLVLGAVGDDDAAPGGFSLFYTTNYNPVMQGSQLGCHSSNSFQTIGSDWIAIHDGLLRREICVELGTIMNFRVTLDG